jgi:hypothetical protein
MSQNQKITDWLLVNAFNFTLERLRTDTAKPLRSYSKRSPEPSIALEEAFPRDEMQKHPHRIAHSELCKQLEHGC